MKFNLLNRSELWKQPFFHGFVTDRLSVTPMVAADINQFKGSGITPDILFFVNSLDSLTNLEQWLRDVFKKINYFLFIVQKRETKKDQSNLPVGVLMLYRAGDSTIEIGGWINKEAQGQRYASEVIHSLVKFLKNGATQGHLCAEIAAENLLAEKVLFKNGFVSGVVGSNDKKKTYYVDVTK